MQADKTLHKILYILNLKEGKSYSSNNPISNWCVPKGNAQDFLSSQHERIYSQ